jgi:hypothetical protein
LDRRDEGMKGHRPVETWEGKPPGDRGECVHYNGKLREFIHIPYLNMPSFSQNGHDSLHSSVILIQGKLKSCELASIRKVNLFN